MSGRSKHGAAKQGLYDENNPPPPPPGPPPSSAVRREQTKDREPARLHKRFNSRQRRKFREQKFRDESQTNHASDVAAKNIHQSSAKNRAEETIEEEDEQDGDGDDRHDVHGRRRRSLRDARKYTPDQIMDETPGRLSPENWQGAPESTGRWLDETVQRRRDFGDEQVYGRSRQGSPYEGQGEPYGQEDQGRYRSRSRENQDRWAYRSDIISRTPERYVSQPYGLEDEVDWEDGEAFDLPSKKQSSKKRGPPPKQYQNMDPGKPAHGKKRPTSPPISQRKQKRHTRNGNAADDQQQYSQQHWAPKSKGVTQAPPPSKEYGDQKYIKTGRFNQTESKFNQTEPNKQVRDPLLEDDPTLLGLTTGPAPETAYDLREYDHHIFKLQHKLPKYQTYSHANGKVGPHKYGTSTSRELGLCFVTFCTTGRCEMGVRCAWRHHPLTKAEREWILQIGGQKGRVFLENLARCWAVPEVPTPGASMHDK